MNSITRIAHSIVYICLWAGVATCLVPRAEARLVSTPYMNIVSNLLSDRRDDFEKCYRKYPAKRGQPTSGSAMAKFIITPNGKTTQVRVGQGSLLNKNVSQCVAGVIRDTEFPETPQSADVPVYYPIQFWLDEPKPSRATRYQSHATKAKHKKSKKSKLSAKRKAGRKHAVKSQKKQMLSARGPAGTKQALKAKHRLNKKQALKQKQKQKIKNRAALRAKARAKAKAKLQHSARAKPKTAETRRRPPMTPRAPASTD